LFDLRWKKSLDFKNDLKNISSENKYRVYFIKLFWHKFIDAATLSITVLSIMPCSIMTTSIMTLSISIKNATLRVTTLKTE